MWKTRTSYFPPPCLELFAHIALGIIMLSNDINKFVNGLCNFIIQIKIIIISLQIPLSHYGRLACIDGLKWFAISLQIQKIVDQRLKLRHTKPILINRNVNTVNDSRVTYTHLSSETQSLTNKINHTCNKIVFAEVLIIPNCSFKWIFDISFFEL